MTSAWSPRALAHVGAIARASSVAEALVGRSPAQRGKRSCGRRASGRSKLARQQRRDGYRPACPLHGKGQRPRRRRAIASRAERSGRESPSQADPQAIRSVILTPKMTLDANKQVVRRWMELWNERGVDGVDELFGSDFRDEELAASRGQPITLDLFKASLQALIEAMGHAQFEEHELVAERDQVMVRWTVRGVHQAPMWGASPTGEPFAIEGINIFTVRDGKIVARRSFLDPAGMVALTSSPNPA
jgi:steroid delta-isomerase-like uncharacterized protein